ncbi:MAG: STAS domain-containing protein [Planctomycetes bacterium]|nr:STAS domain-containing protein [Planctomycetota bacterium]MCW8138969.1 STAS domain-containing protein [Planctomycetota bacterium]
MSELRIETRDLEDGVTVLSLDGVLDKRSVAPLEQRVRELIDGGRLKLVVNCERLSQLSNDGMSVFLSHLIKLKKAGGDIKFCRMSPEVKSVLALLHLTKLLVVKETEAEAVADFAAQARQRPKEGEKLRIDVDEVGDVSICSLHGFVDRHTINLLDSTLSGLLERGRARIVIDCAELTYISSNGMGVFISYVSKARSQGGDIKLCTLRDVARTVITMLGLHRHFEVFEARADAITSFA